MRAFVGSRVAGLAEAQIADMSAMLVDASAGRLRAVPAGTLHLTYAFIGELPDERLDDVARAIDTAVSGLCETRVTFGAPEILYGGREARLVLLSAVDGAAWLAALARRIAEALEPVLPGLAVSATPAPHVTIARFRRGTLRRDAGSVAATIDAGLTPFGVETTIDSVQLFESRLLPGGPEYIVRHACQLVG